MENDDFANISWQNNPTGHGGRGVATNPGGEGEDDASGNANGKRQGGVGPLGHNADALDLAGVGEGVLECTVTQPIKENDGSKDAYVSYLVTTNVGLPSHDLNKHRLTLPDYFPLLSKTNNDCSQTIHRLCISVQDLKQRIPSMCCSSVTRQAQDGIRPGRSLWTRLHTTPSQLSSSISHPLSPPPSTSTKCSTHYIPRKHGLECDHEDKTPQRWLWI